MENRYIMAYDCGTTAVKAIVVSFEGQIICDAKEEYPLIQLHPGWAEQDPAVLWDAICLSTKKAVAKAGISPDDVMGMVFAAPWKNIIPIDKDGKILRNSIIWMDARASKQAERLNEKMGSFVGTGQEYWPRLMWVKENEPEIWEKAHVIMGLNTYFKWRATGHISTEPSDDFIHTCDPDIQSYYDRVLTAAGLDEDLNKFPRMQLSTDKIGEVTMQAAQEMGLRSGIVVFGGFGDLVAITIGTGCCKDEDLHIYFGTSAWLVNIKPKRIPGFAPLNFVFDPTHDGAAFALQTGCLAFDWAVSQFYHAEREILGDEIMPYVDKQVAAVEAGSLNLVATHWFNGELPPLGQKNAKALFYNLTTSHDRRHMVRAVMESLCYTQRLYIESFEKDTGKKLESIRVVGGGAGSRVWMQMLADVLGIRVQVPESPRYTGAMGAYYCAMIGLGRLDNYDAIYDAVVIQEEFIPNLENAVIYDKLYRIYTKLYPTLRELNREINGEY